jgi:hypothetical protein
MKYLYEINSGSYQRHFVVASSYAIAEKLWIEKYESKPLSIIFV